MKIQLSEEMNLLYFYTVASCAPLPCKYHSYLQSQFDAALYNTIIIIVMIIIISIHIHHAYIQAFIPFVVISFYFSVYRVNVTLSIFVAFSSLLVYAMRSLVKNDIFFFIFGNLNEWNDLCLILDNLFLLN